MATRKRTKAESQAQVDIAHRAYFRWNRSDALFISVHKAGMNYFWRWLEMHGFLVKLLYQGQTLSDSKHMYSGQVLEVTVRPREVLNFGDDNFVTDREILEALASKLNFDSSYARCTEEERCSYPGGFDFSLPSEDPQQLFEMIVAEARAKATGSSIEAEGVPVVE